MGSDVSENEVSVQISTESTFPRVDGPMELDLRVVFSFDDEVTFGKAAA